MHYVSCRMKKGIVESGWIDRQVFTYNKKDYQALACCGLWPQQGENNIQPIDGNNDKNQGGAYAGIRD